jgi:phycocyanin beta chain
LVGNDQIDALLAVVKDGAKRTDVVNRITGAASAIVINAARALFEEQP